VLRIFVSIGLKLKDEKKKLKDYMNTNKETLDIFSQLLNDNKSIIIGKSRQSGSSASLMAWHSIYSKYERARIRRETIKRIFNI
jgi:hypothetical protein